MKVRWKRLTKQRTVLQQQVFEKEGWIMGKVSSYDIVDEMVSEATEKFGERYVLNQTKYDLLDEACGIIDLLVDEFGVECVEVEVDDIIMRLTIAIECGDIVLQDGRKHDFFKLTSMLDSFSFSRTEKGELRMEFRLDNMWLAAY